jgi:lipopolysaccharide export system permease protein
MPTIIDRYMLRQFVQVLVICFMSMVGLYIVIDAFGHLDHFVDYADKHGNLLGTMAKFYAYRTLSFFDWTSGLLALTAAMFTVTWIQRHQEMTALLAAGIPRLRVLRPVLVAAIAVSILAVANREWMIPNSRQQLALDSKNLGGEHATELKARFDSQSDILIGGDTIVPAEKKIVRPNFMLPPGLDEYGRQLTAHEATFLPATADRPSGYLLSGVSAPKLLLTQPTLKINDRPVILAPRDYDWLADHQVFVVSGVSFEFLSAGSNWRDHASTRELIHELRSPSTDLGADVRYTIHSRLMQPLLDATLLFLGLPLVISKGNRNPFVAIGMCVAVVTLFMTVRLGCQSLCLTGWLLPPLAAWLPLMIFAPAAVLMAEPLRQ